MSVIIIKGCIYSVSSSNLSDIVKTQEHYSSPFVGAETIGMDTETILVNTLTHYYKPLCTCITFIL